MKKISFLFGMLATCITLQAAVEEISVSRALEIISALEDGASTTEQYIVKGVVSEIITTDEGLVTYQNCDFWMRDSDNATLKLKAFRTKGIAGAAFTVGLIAVGDTVRVQGVLMNYVNTTTSERLSEIYKGNLVEVVAGNTGGGNSGGSVTDGVSTISYNFDDATLTAQVTYRGSDPYEYTNEYTGDVVIPTTVTYDGKTYSVTSIGKYAFCDCSDLTSVTIPNSVTSIGDYAFFQCSSLTSITIPNSITSIGKYAFRNCSGLTSVTIPNSVTSIGVGAFEGCSSLTSMVVASGNSKYDSRNNCNAIIETATNTLIAGCQSTTIPNSVTSIGEDAFSGCSGLTSVTIPNFVTSIGEDAFSGCSGLTSVTIPNFVTSIGYRAFYNCSGLTSVTIGNSVTSIEYRAFDGCSSLTSVVWNAKNFENFSSSPFYDIASQITSFTFGEEMEHIPANLCYGMENLTSVTIPNSVTSIGYRAFMGCSGLTSVIVENGNTNYDSRNNCNAIIETATNTLIAGCQSTTIPNSVTIIGEGAFAGCSGLTSVTIPSSVTSIGEYAFYGCSGLTSVVWNAKNCVIVADDDAPIILNDLPFYDIASQITSFTFGNEVEHIPADLCYGMSNLTSVTIGNSVESIGVRAFKDCSELKTVVIGNAVTNIGDGAFYGCDRLLYFTCYAEEPPFVGTDPFSTYNVYLKVPCSGLDAYKMYDVWRNFNNISCIGSEEVQVTEFSVTPSTNEAQFTWPAESGAATYELVISKDGVVFCTLTFNANGQLMGIAFAPSANAPAAAPTTSGFQFTVTGLDEASHYTYTFDAKDAGGNVIKHYAGEFNTDGYVGLEQIELANIYTQDGRIVCEGEFRIYDLLGRDVTRLNGSLCGVYVVKNGNSAVKVVVK